MSQLDEVYARMNDDLEVPHVDLSRSEIRKFYDGKTILLTGATGFMGKCLVEKLLRDCSLRRLYVLVREKRGVSQEEKMKKYFQNYIFDRLRSLKPDFEKTVVTIKGDLEIEDLALSEKDRKTIIDEVDLMIHNAAIVKFDENIAILLQINVLATKKLLDLGMECKRLKAFMYVSTAYSHCYVKDIEEKFYDSPADIKMVKDMIESAKISDKGLTPAAMKMLLGKWANGYTFSKSVAEDLVRQYGEKGKFACGVYRPTIVTGASAEPLAGWLGNNNGPALVMLGTGLGVVHVSPYTGATMDLIPVDLSINALIAAIYDLPEQWEAEGRAIMYNYGSSTENPVNLNQFLEYVLIDGPNIGSKKLIWYPFIYFTANRFKFMCLHIIFHFIPAIFADLGLIIMRKKPRALQLFFFATKHLDKLFYFMNGNWRVHAKRTMAICDRLNDADKQIFDFDVRKLDWEIFINRYMRYQRIYLLKEPMNNTSEASKRYRQFQFLHYTISTVVLYFVFCWVWRLVTYLLSAVF